MRRNETEVTMKTKVASTMRLFLLRLGFSATILVLCALTSRAGGPTRVAGSAYFDPAVNGQPLTWPQGEITYYVDQGNLSPVLPNSEANALVASSGNGRVDGYDSDEQLGDKAPAPGERRAAGATRRPRPGSQGRGRKRGKR